MQDIIKGAMSPKTARVVKLFLFLVPFILALFTLYQFLTQVYTDKLGELIVVKSTLAYTSPRLHERPVEEQICIVFGEDCQMALAISQAENGTRDCKRVGVSGDLGVFQIAPQYHARRGGDLTDCLDNIMIAKEIFDESGWHAWQVYKNGSYQRFLQ